MSIYKNTLSVASFCLVTVAYAAGPNEIKEILDPVTTAACEVVLESGSTQMALGSEALVELAHRLFLHGATYPMGLGRANPKEKPVVLSRDVIQFMLRFHKAAGKRRLYTTNFSFELEAAYIASDSNGRHIFEFRPSTDMRAFVLLATNKNLGPNNVQMMLVFEELSTGTRLEFEQIFRGRASYTRIGKAKSNPIEETGMTYVFRGNDYTSYLGKDGANKRAGSSAEVYVSDHFPNKPLKVSFKFYAAM